MPETEESIDIKFRLDDGSDMGPFRYSSASTVDCLKQRVLSDWPKGFTFHIISNYLSIIEKNIFFLLLKQVFVNYGTNRATLATCLNTLCFCVFSL